VSQEDQQHPIIAQPIGGTFTLTYGAQTTIPRYDASGEVVNHTMNELVRRHKAVSDRIPHALITSRAIKHN
jgi:hypothetical protein